MQVKTLVRDGVIAVGLFAGMVLVGANVTRSSPATPQPTVADMYSEAAYAAKTEVVEGELIGSALGALSELSGDTHVIVVLRRDDIIRCEDLGRQLRELRRSLASHVNLSVWSDTVDVLIVRRFLQTERVSEAMAQPIAMVSVLRETPEPITPLALVVRQGVPVTRGVAHPGRFANSRPRSFAAELAELLTASERAYEVDPQTAWQ
jgi:hypothetical protein